MPAVTRIIAIAGGSGSGKTTLAEALSRRIASVHGPGATATLRCDDYYRDQSRHFAEDGGAVNFDHPSALDFELLEEHLTALRRGLSIDVPRYDFGTHRRLPRTATLQPRPFVLVDGILVLAAPRVRDCFDGSIFVSASESVRFSRRLARDVRERGRDPQGVRRQLENHVRPMHDRFVETCRQHATLVVSGEDGDPPFEARVEEILTSALFR